jgi:Ribosome inactivating protein
MSTVGTQGARRRLTVREYNSMIVDARQKLTRLEGWIRETYPTGHDWFTVEGDVHLYYRLNDLYILGFRVGDCGYTFQKVEGFMVPGLDDRKLRFGCSYANMGWSGNEPIRVNMYTITEALNVLRNCKVKEPDEGSMLQIVIAFSEAIRLQDVKDCIMKDRPIERDQLDWNRRTNQRDFWRGRSGVFVRQTKVERSES